MWDWVISVLHGWSVVLDHLLMIINPLSTVLLGLTVVILLCVRVTRPYTKAWMPIVAFLWMGVFSSHQGMVLEFFTGRVSTLPQVRYLEAYFPMLVLIGIAQFVILYVCVSYTGDIREITAKTAQAKLLRKIASGTLLGVRRDCGDAAVSEAFFNTPATEPTTYDWDPLAELNELPCPSSRSSFLW